MRSREVVRRPRGSTAARWSGQSSETDEDAIRSSERGKVYAGWPRRDLYPARVRIDGIEHFSDEEAAGE